MKDFFSFKWLGLYAGTALNLVSGRTNFFMMIDNQGTSFIFGVYAPYLKDHLDLRQSEVNLIGAFGSAGAFFNLIPGITVDYIGARPTGIAASLLILSGYFLLWLSVSKKIEYGSFVILGLYTFMIGIGSAATSTAGYDPNLVNFPNDKGKVSAVISGAFGLSSALFSGIYSLFYKEHVPSFLFFLGIVCGGVCCIGSLVLVSEKNEKQIEGRQYKVLSINEELERQSQQQIQYPSEVFGKDVDEDIRDLVYSDGPRLEDLPSYEEESFLELHQEVEDLNGLQSMKTLNFWLLFFAFLGATGTSSTVLNALSSMIVAIGGHEGQQDLMITLNAFACFAGTFLGGFFADVLQNYLHKPCWLLIALVLEGLCFVAMLISPVFWWNIIIPAFGFAYGLVWAVVPAITGDLFGGKYWGTNFALINLAPASASYAFAALSGLFYDARTKEGESCSGHMCYAETFFMGVGLSIVCSIISAVIIVRTKKFYFASLNH